MITVWCAALELSAEQLARCAALLSTDERERAAHFRTSALRDRYVAGRGQLRQMLAAALEQPPAALVFIYGEHRKPSLLGSGLHFNISHTSQYMLCAISPFHNVGIDLEDTRRQVEILSIAEQFFSVQEVSALLSLAGSEQRQLFFEVWTRKEAYLKARGWGIAQGGLAQPIAPNARSMFTAHDGTSWHAVTFAPLPHHCAALVTDAPEAAYTLGMFSPA
jgi:4'-phosphopantetheinyl transferase